MGDDLALMETAASAYGSGAQAKTLQDSGAQILIETILWATTHHREQLAATDVPNEQPNGMPSAVSPMQLAATNAHVSIGRAWS